MSSTDSEFAIRRGSSSLTLGHGARPTPEQLCLVRAATGEPEAIRTALREWRSRVDLSGPIDGGSYRLIPTVYHRLQVFDIDDPNRGKFKGVYRRSMVEGAQVVHAVTPALRALHDAGITPWVMKGVALVQAGYYPTIAARPMLDVDIVVDSIRRPDASAALHAAGYVPKLTDRQMAHRHGAPYVNSAGHELDLHWHHLHDARHDEADRIVTRTSASAHLNGVRVKFAGPTGQLIVTLVHGMVPNPEPAVRWFVDASLILDRDADLIAWDDVLEFARKFRLARRLQWSLGLLAETTHHTAPDEVVRALADLPTTAVEWVDGRVAAAPWNSLRGRVLQVVAGYAGEDRELRHVVGGLPTYLAWRWNVSRVRYVPIAAIRKLAGWLRHGSPT